MFTLVKFPNETYYITLSKKVQLLKNSDCIVRYKGRGKYQAVFIKSGDDQNELVKIQKQRELASINTNFPSLETSETISENISTVTNSNDGKRFEQYEPSYPSNNNKQDLLVYQLSAASCSTPKTDSYNEGTSTLNILDSTYVLQEVSSPINISELSTSNSQSRMPNVSIEENVLIDQVLQNGSINSECQNIFNFADDHLVLDPEITYTINSDQELQHTNKSQESSISLNQEGTGHDNDESLNECIVNAGRNEYDYIEHDENLSEYSANDGKSEGENNENDMDYVPDSGSNISYNNSVNSVSRRKTSSLPNTVPFDSQKVTVPESKSKNRRTVKKYFCPYCNKLQTKFARHLEMKHKNEPDVEKFIKLPKRNLERGRIIETIRKKGNYLHNTQPELNSGILITCRQPQPRFHKIPEDYIPCSSCKGFFSKRTLRLHFARCNRNHKKGVRNITVMGRRCISYIHNRACQVLRQFIFPVMRDDEVTRCIRYDNLLIIFGNKMCEKYSHSHQHDMIRAHLRLLGRFKLSIKEINKEIDDFASIFQPKFFDCVIMAVQQCAKYDLNTKSFKTPAVATTLGTLLKKCLRHHTAECIKTQEHEKKKSAEDFLILFDDDFPTVINKKVLEDQTKKKREKKVILPSKQDIKLLYDFLKGNCDRCVEYLKIKFQQSSWKDLCENTLILVQMFNRRRAGEIERLLISDFKNQETIDKSADKDMFKQLSKESREYARKYIRLTIRGKLGRTVPVLLDSNLVKYINTILKYRIVAGVKSDNEYIFGVPNTHNLKKKYLRACILMRKFSRECGASIPTSLRGTTLRKHIATYTAIIGIEENKVSDLADFMGHNKQIHKDIYRMSRGYKDITGVSRILHDAIFSKEDESGPVEESSDDDGGDVEKTVVSRSSEDSEGNTSFPISSLDSSKRRSTSPFGKTKRTKWSDAERAAVEKIFGDPTKVTKLPTLNECQDAINRFKVLGRRQPQQLKTWIDNQRKAKSRAKMRHS